MKVFVAGATGALGRVLVPQLVAGGHDVVGLTRTPSKQDFVRGLGARPVVADALDPDAVARAVAEAEPEVIVHQLTALSGSLDLRHIERDLRRDEPAAHRGHRPPAGRGPRRRRAALRRPELRRLAERPHRRTGEGRVGPARPHPARRAPDHARGHPPSRGGGHRGRLDRGRGAPLRRLLRPRHVLQRQAGGRARGDDPQAQVPGGRERRGRVVLHPHRGRGGGHRRGGRARRARASTTWSTTSRRRSPSGSRPRPGPWAPSRRGGCRAGSAGSRPARRRPS